MNSPLKVPRWSIANFSQCPVRKLHYKPSQATWLWLIHAHSLGSRCTGENLQKYINHVYHRTVIIAIYLSSILYGSKLSTCMTVYSTKNIWLAIYFRFSLTLWSFVGKILSKATLPILACAYVWTKLVFFGGGITSNYSYSFRSH